MYIFQPSRYLLDKYIGKYKDYVKGRVLDAGAGRYNRYGHLFSYSEYVRMDIEKFDGIDIVGGLDKIPFNDNSFDSIISTQVFEYILDPNKAVVEFFRVLKPNGHCLVTLPQTNEADSVRDYWRFTEFGVVELFSKNGFSVVEYSQVGGFFTMISQQKIRYLIDKLGLYKHHLWGRVFNKLFFVYGIFMIWLDGLDRSSANRKHTIGWCAVFKKL